MLSINDFLCAAPDTSTVIEGVSRLVGVDSQNFAYLIRVDESPLKGPIQIPMLQLQAAIQAGEVLLDQEITIELPPTLEVLNSAGIEKVKKSMDVLTPLVLDDNVLFNPEYRARMFAQRGEECKIHPRQIRRLYYRYMWGGQTELALAPMFSRCGGRGQKQKPGSKKRGRKPQDSTVASQVSLPDVREKLEKGAKKFYLPDGLTLEEAFIETKNKYFTRGLHIERGAPVTAILLPKEQLPSLAQFRYVCGYLGKTRKNGRRIRQKLVEWEFRGRNRDNVPGPGYRFEIDATKLQVRLVSRYDRSKTLKDPTLYAIIDVWSGAIVGYALSFHNASWALASKALQNCFTDKQEVFERLGMNWYSREDWPCQHLPQRLAADRGELVSNKAGLIPEIGLKVEIMPPMCPQLKGKVEASIKDVKHGHSHRLPGRHPKNRQRRETDGTETAALTIEEMERVIVEIIIGLNHEPAPAAHIPPEMIEEGETDVTRIGLYRWGVERYTLTRSLTKEKIWESLLMKGEAALTPKGLNFKCQTYRLPAGANVMSRWRASGKGNPLVHVRYDEHHADQIWFMDQKEKKWVPASNVSENIKRRKAAFYELEISRQEVKHLRRLAKDENLHRESERRQRINAIITQAEEETKEDRKGVSIAGRKKDRMENTQLERAASEMIASGATAMAPAPQPTPAVGAQKDITGAVSPGPLPAPSGETKNHPENKIHPAELSIQMWED
ncbi:Integrase core domain-containing protein [Geoalkalibacter ferrihydriticus]|uniref:Integrase catalytic domain-containing protein n=2 Tax=Geoalkalibacter ferrihydriticus TaxID=392333 RepID=A0A0C2HH11_9BACT|nr:DDE-type integrase/transposase/recombinase [Geoalkalibacter ferrihydriticus]KIH76256.1 hypothetical protein GFER_11605 [Geoalkalibacter ferrihydriticus DSM 17813]SDL24134.1 Integrase core domain-containing protein [Geoalkalibacter ferrihydriticus]